MVRFVMICKQPSTGGGEKCHTCRSANISFPGLMTMSRCSHSPIPTQDKPGKLLTDGVWPFQSRRQPEPHPSGIKEKTRRYEVTLDNPLTAAPRPWFFCVEVVHPHLNTFPHILWLKSPPKRHPNQFFWVSPVCKTKKHMDGSKVLEESCLFCCIHFRNFNA